MQYSTTMNATTNSTDTFDISLISLDFEITSYRPTNSVEALMVNNNNNYNSCLTALVRNSPRETVPER